MAHGARRKTGGGGPVKRIRLKGGKVVRLKVKAVNIELRRMKSRCSVL